MTSNSRSDKSGTLRIKRSPKVKTDERGRTVWVGEIEDADFELVSTRHVKAILESGDTGKVDEILRIAETGSQGVLVQDCANGRFDVLDQTSLEELMQHPDPPISASAEPGDELELMETRVLRKLLITDGKIEKPSDNSDSGEGHDPYNSGPAKDSSRR